MTASRLPASVSTLYSETVDQAQALDLDRSIGQNRPGSVVEKQIGQRTYLYWQLRIGDRTSQTYLGPDSASLRDQIQRLVRHRADQESRVAALDRLAAMLARGGALREAAGSAAALRLLADLGLFRRGGVVVGTQAFRAYGNLLGYSFESASSRTEDVDVAHAIEIAIASRDEPPPPIQEGLERLGFLPVPGFDRRHASTSFSMRGRETRIDFLTPSRGRPRSEPVAIPALGLAAHPLPMLDYLIVDPIPAVIVGPSAVLVRIPEPARFALHKLWVAAKRPTHEAAKARKDRRQAEELLEVLLEDRPGDLDLAWEALAARPVASRVVAAELARSEDVAARAVRARLGLEGRARSRD